MFIETEPGVTMFVPDFVLTGEYQQQLADIDRQETAHALVSVTGLVATTVGVLSLASWPATLPLTYAAMVVWGSRLAKTTDTFDEFKILSPSTLWRAPLASVASVIVSPFLVRDWIKFTRQGRK